MSSLRVRLDYRDVRGRLWDMRDNLINVSENPEVKTDINKYIWDNFLSTGIPFDTGALEDSPEQNFSRSGGYAKHRYAQGGIGPDGIVFDPVEIRGGDEIHYARYATYTSGRDGQKWSPEMIVRDNMDEIMEYVKEVMVEGINNG